MSKNVLIPHNEVFTIKNILSPAECAEYIALSEKLGYTEVAITTHLGCEMRPNLRNSGYTMLHNPKCASELWQRVSEYIPSKIGEWRAIGLNERFRFYRYDPGQRFAIHHDSSYRRSNGEESLLTFMIYLNEDFEGGETCFYPPYDHAKESSISVVPITGMTLCFVHALPHEGTPVIQGRKYVLRSDVMYSAD
jgi:predicted 2-oxoglutarate/Fe(II)-dependent dioxygenase YbiX